MTIEALVERIHSIHCSHIFGVDILPSFCHHLSSCTRYHPYHRVSRPRCLKVAKNFFSTLARKEKSLEDANKN